MMVGLGSSGPRSAQEFIYYFAPGFDGGLVARHNHSTRIANLLIRIGQYEEVARHVTNHSPKDKEPRQAIVLPRLKLIEPSR
jgi:hypothetical protein